MRLAMLFGFLIMGNCIVQANDHVCCKSSSRADVFLESPVEKQINWANCGSLLLRDCFWFLSGKSSLAEGDMEGALRAYVNISPIVDHIYFGDLGGTSSGLREGSTSDNAPVITITNYDVFLSTIESGAYSVTTSNGDFKGFDWAAVESALTNHRNAFPDAFHEQYPADIVINAVAEISEECLFKAIGACYGAGYIYPRLRTSGPSVMFR